MMLKKYDPLLLGVLGPFSGVKMLNFRAYRPQKVGSYTNDA